MPIGVIGLGTVRQASAAQQTGCRYQHRLSFRDELEHLGQGEIQDPTRSAARFTRVRGKAGLAADIYLPLAMSLHTTDTAVLGQVVSDHAV
jgi:hypothetical protein